MPSVISLTLASFDKRSWKRTLKPTTSPSGVFSSSAIRLATLDAAIRRGCVWPIQPPPLTRPRPIESAIFGNCVVLPDPVSPQTMTTWWARMAAAISSRRAETGSDSGNSIRSRGETTAPAPLTCTVESGSDIDADYSPRARPARRAGVNALFAVIGCD